MIILWLSDIQHMIEQLVVIERIFDNKDTDHHIITRWSINDNQMGIQSETIQSFIRWSDN